MRIIDFFDGFSSSEAPDTTAGAVYQENIGTGDGSTTQFNLSLVPIYERAIIVFANRVMEFGTEWTYDDINNRVTFLTAPAAATDIYVVYLYSAALTGGGGGGGAGNRIVEYHSVTAGEETAKQFSLSSVPADPDETVVDIIAGPSQQYNVDFLITGDTFDWSGLGLDGILSTGDVVRLVYFI